MRLSAALLLAALLAGCSAPPSVRPPPAPTRISVQVSKTDELSNVRLDGKREPLLEIEATWFGEEGHRRFQGSCVVVECWAWSSVFTGANPGKIPDAESPSFSPNATGQFTFLRCRPTASGFLLDVRGYLVRDGAIERRAEGELPLAEEGGAGQVPLRERSRP